MSEKRKNMGVFNASPVLDKYAFTYCNNSCCLHFAASCIVHPPEKWDGWQHTAELVKNHKNVLFEEGAGG